MDAQKFQDYLLQKITNLEEKMSTHHDMSQKELTEIKIAIGIIKEKQRSRAALFGAIGGCLISIITTLAPFLLGWVKIKL